MRELERAVGLLQKGEYTCVICDRDRVLTDELHEKILDGARAFLTTSEAKSIIEAK